MHIHFEKTINAQCDCTVLSMSWMGKVPDELPEDEGWKLNRTHYYQEGWLATGNVRGVLGVTYTTSHWKKNPSEVPLRVNYNLRGHRSQITLVQWNEPYQKLASCDSAGIIFVWIKFEGRWSIELINDRNTPVTHFSWSHDGRMALICYQDCFVLVGSVAGQRYWSTMLNLDATITCGIWTPDDQQVYFGTSNGQIVVMDVHGVMVSQVQLPSDSPISSMAWSCEKFKMEESEDGEATSSSNHYCNKRPFLLAVCFKTGGIYLMKSYDDVAPIYISTGMHGLQMEWSNSGEFLAVAGSRPIEVLHENGNRVKEYSNSLHVYNHQGIRIVNINIPHVLSPVTAMTWGHNDKRIFVATGKLVHVGWVSKRIASLQLLCRLAIYKTISTEACVSHLPLPIPVRTLISSLHTQTIPSPFPDIKDLRDFVVHPPSGNRRLYCTMIRHDDDATQSPGTTYTLYLEFLGGLIPILKGKRTSKIRPEFVIYDPQAIEGRSFSFSTPIGSERSASCVGEGGCSCRCHSRQHAHFHQQSNHGSNPTDNVVSSAPCISGACPSAAASAVSVSTNISSVSGTMGVALGASSASSSSCKSSNNGSNVPANCNHQQQHHCHCCHHQHPSCNTSSSSNTSTMGSTQASLGLGLSDSSESEDVELCASPRMQRKRYRNRQRERERLLEREREREWERTRSSVHLLPEPTHPHQLVYNDVLPEAMRLAEVTSNIWGTKFKVHGTSTSLPDSLGQVTYKTSLLHLQPRQMTVLITELRDDIFLPLDGPFLNSSYMEEEEEDLSVVVGGPQPSSSQQQHLQHGALVMQNGGGGGGGGGNNGGVRGDIYTGANVIYHPQGVPRGEDSPPIISTSRCYLQSAPATNQSQQQGAHGCSNGASSIASSSSNIPSMGGSCASPYRSICTAAGPSSSSGASTSSCCSSSNHLQYYASSSASTATTKSDSIQPFDLDDQDEFPYVDLTVNADLVNFRETLRSSFNNESISVSAAAAMAGRDPIGIHNFVSNCRSSMCQVCETTGMLSTSPQTPVKVATTTTVGGGGNSEISVDLSEKVIQRVKYGLTRAQIERVVDNDGNSGSSMVGGVATSTPSPPRSSSRSIRSPKKVSGVGTASTATNQGISRLPASTHNHYTSSVSAEVGHLQAAVSNVCAPPASSLSAHHHHHPLQPQPIPVTAPMFVRRSMSASYLDNVDRNVVFSLDVVGNDAAQNSPPKRLVLVKKKDKGNSNENGGTSSASGGKPRLKDWGKSKSWDSCDLSGWKKASGATGSSTSSTSMYRREVPTSSCPKCRFPSTEPIKSCVTMAEPLLHCRAKVPMTPARRNMMTNCSTSRTSQLIQNSSGNLSTTSSNNSSGSSNKSVSSREHMSSIDDVIEVASDSSPVHVPNNTNVPTPQTPPAPVHRRSLSLLTPLLRRREMLNAARQQQSADNGTSKSRNGSNSSQQSTTNHPHSSTFIPPGSPQHQPRSSPSTPATQRRSKQSYLSSASSPFRQLFVNSPLLTRRKNKANNANNNGNATTTTTMNKGLRRRSIIDSSDDEGVIEETNCANHNGNNIANQNPTSNHHQAPSLSTGCPICDGAPCAHCVPSCRDCEMFHRSLYHQKMGKKKLQYTETCPMAPRRREFLMHNKAPMWNENSQVYQLDFGGRVTQESAKNFQIEFRGKQVMQFGRIDGSAYTLDFQQPFSAVQAFAVALANVTQRLK